MRRTWAIALVAAAVVLAALGPRIRVGWLAARLLYETARPFEASSPARLRAEPLVQVIELEVGHAVVVADLYRPPGRGPHPGILLVHGMADAGRSDERLTRFADALARAGYVVLVPDLEGLRRFRVSLDDVGTIVSAFEHLRSAPGVRTDRVAMFGASYSGALALLAAADPAIADGVRFCFLLGAYHDLRNVIVFMTTGHYRVDGQWARLEPENFGRWVFLLNVDDVVESPSDRETLERIALAKLADPDADVFSLVGRLGAEGRRVFDIITATDPDAAVALLDELPERASEYLARLSPKGSMASVKARLILVHGRDDNMIPYTESLALAEEAPAGTRTRLELLGSFRHVDLIVEPDGGVHSLARAAAEILALYSIAWDIVAEGRL
ncbi:MAG: alpha/beta fold hydrolase [Candidatus Eisenbacteria bacterium]|nr:alpha/beta fold hydrolase [Candidatus Eisenbacteria bacterium]